MAEQDRDGVAPIDRSAASGTGIRPAPSSAPDRQQGLRLWDRLTGSDGHEPWRPYAAVAVVVLGSLVLALVPLVWNSRFYWWDDTINGAFGQWYHTGQALRSGTLPMLEPSVWSSGNLFAEGQWGSYNPLVWAVSLGASYATDAALYTTVVKLVAIVVGALGVYVLARHFGSNRMLAVLASLTAPFNGVTSYFDASSWVTGLFAWVLIPWFWFFLRRIAVDGRNILPAFLTGYFIVTIGYVHGTIALVMVGLGVVAAAALRRQWKAFARTLGTGVLLGLVAITVYLPSVLTAPVTNRSATGVNMDQLMTLDLSGLAMSAVPSALPQVASWWWPGLTAAVPMAYIAWSLPLFAFLDLGRLRAALSRRTDLLIVMGLVLAFMMLPTAVGPLRYPARMTPYLALTLIVLLSSLLSTVRIREMRRPRLVAALGLVAVGWFLTWAQTPQFRNVHLAAVVLCASAVVAMYWVWTLSRTDRRQLIAAGGVAVVLVASFGSVWLQHWMYRSPAWEDQGLPSKVEDFQRPMSQAVNDVIVIGTPPLDPVPRGLWSETLQANTWYLNSASVMNRYQLLGFSSFNYALCLEYVGGTCPGLLKTLFTVRPETGLILADEIRVDTIQIIKRAVPRSQRDEPPAGWSVVEDGRHTVTWTRDEPLGRAGGVVWSSDGTTVTEVSRTSTEVAFRVDEVGPDGGVVAMSRLAWPGYSTSGGILTTPVSDYLLAVELSPADEDTVISVVFRPPGWYLELACLAVAVLGALAWSVLLARRQRRVAPLVVPDVATPEGGPAAALEGHAAGTLEENRGKEPASV